MKWLWSWRSILLWWALAIIVAIMVGIFLHNPVLLSIGVGAILGWIVSYLQHRKQMRAHNEVRESLLRARAELLQEQALLQEAIVSMQ